MSFCFSGGVAIKRPRILSNFWVSLTMIGFMAKIVSLVGFYELSIAVILHSGRRMYFG